MLNLFFSCVYLYILRSCFLFRLSSVFVLFLLNISQFGFSFVSIKVNFRFRYLI